MDSLIKEIGIRIIGHVLGIGGCNYQRLSQ